MKRLFGVLKSLKLNANLYKYRDILIFNIYLSKNSNYFRTIYNQFVTTFVTNQLQNTSFPLIQNPSNDRKNGNLRSHQRIRKITAIDELPDLHKQMYETRLSSGIRAIQRPISRNLPSAERYRRIRCNRWRWQRVTKYQWNALFRDRQRPRLHRSNTDSSRVQSTRHVQRVTVSPRDDKFVRAVGFRPILSIPRSIISTDARKIFHNGSIDN